MWTRPRIGLFVGPHTVQSVDLRQRKPLGSFAQLAQALEPLAGSRARLELVLSDAYCRYLVVTRPAGIRNRAELAAALQGRFRAMFGEAERWRFRHETSPMTEHDFVAGADGTLLDDIEERAQVAGLRVASIRPHWVAWAQHFHRHTRRGNHWVVGTDGAWVTLGYFSNGQCRQARALRTMGSSTRLEDLLARERAFLEDVDAKAPVWLGGSGLAAPAALSTGAPLTTAQPHALWGWPGGGA